MKKNNLYNRRKFVQLVAAGSAASLLPVSLQALPVNSFTNNLQPLKIFVFSKTLQFLDYIEMSNSVKAMGFDGIDLTVRPKGHVLPENVKTHLPKATEAMKAAGLDIHLLSTSVLNPANQSQLDVLKTAKDQGYQCYRTGWLKYDAEIALEKSLINFERQLSLLAKTNADLGLTGGYQNHAGRYLGAPLWDVAKILEKYSSQDLGLQYDIMHATVEGGQSWQIDFERVKKFINAIVIKDFVWNKKDGKWKRSYVPLGEGMVDFDAYFKLLVKNKINVPVSLHFEYDFGGAEKGKTPTMNKEQIFNQMQRDLNFVRKAWEKANNQ